MMLTRNKKILIIALSAFILFLVVGLIIALREPKIKEPEQGDWSIDNQTALSKRGFEEYIEQSSAEPKEKRKERLQKYYTPDSPLLDYDLKEIGDASAERSEGEVLEVRDCHEQEGNDLCLILNTRINYYQGGNKVKTVIAPYWMTINFIPDIGFRVYDLGVWEYGYNENPI